MTPRRLLPGDPSLPAMLDLIRASFAYMEGVIDPPSSMHHLTPEALAAPPAEAWGMGDPLRACMVLTPKGDALYLGRLAVAEDARGQGLARAMVDFALVRAAALGLTAIELQTRIELTANQAAFRAMGFREVGRSAHPGYDRPTSITYRRAVPPTGAPQMSDEPDPDDQRHAQKMAKKKAARDKIMAGKTGEKGLIIVHTGKGKGKSSAAFGMIFRAIAHGMPCAVVQFIKGAMTTGERDLIQRHFADLCQFHTMGEGFTWETQDRARDVAAARAAWDKAKELIRDPAIRMVLLDEINIALRYEYLPLAEVLAFLAEEKPPMTHVILTGRNAAEGLIEAADLVTEMELVKHPFRSGIKAQAGVEF